MLKSIRKLCHKIYYTVIILQRTQSIFLFFLANAPFMNSFNLVNLTCSSSSLLTLFNQRSISAFEYKFSYFK